MTPRQSLILFFGLLPLAALAAGAPERVTIRMKTDPRPTHPRVRLGDVADVEDSNAARRAQILDLDLADFDSGNALSLTRTQMEIRMLLAGFEAGSFTIIGPDRMEIHQAAPQALTDLGIEQAVFHQLCDHYHIPATDLSVKLVNPFIGNWLQNAPLNPRVEAVPTPQLPLGRVQLTVRILDGDRVIAARPASFDIGRRQTVVVASASMDRSRVVAAEHIREEVQFVDSVIDTLTADEVSGRKLAVPLRPGEVVTLRHLAPETTAQPEILIRQGDAVRLIARKGSLTVVVPIAEALQAGREGQLIRVRNVDSSKIVTGRVIARGEVEVPLY